MLASSPRDCTCWAIATQGRRLQNGSAPAAATGHKAWGKARRSNARSPTKGEEGRTQQVHAAHDAPYQVWSRFLPYSAHREQRTFPGPEVDSELHTTIV